MIQNCLPAGANRNKFAILSHQESVAIHRPVISTTHKASNRAARLAGSLSNLLHLYLDGFVSQDSRFREEARRDAALVNKAYHMLVNDMRIPHCWYQMKNEWLVQNAHGRWVKPKRKPQDVPSSSRCCGGYQKDLYFRHASSLLAINAVPDLVPPPSVK